MYTLADYYQLVSERHGALMDAQSRMRCWKVCECLTPAPLVIFEHYLAQKPGFSDIIVANYPSAYCSDTACKLMPSNDAWKKIYKLGKWWRHQDKSSLIRKGVDCLWVELDISKSESSTPAIVFVEGFADKSLFDLRYFQKVLSVLYGMEVPLEITRTFRRCFEALPETARVFALGNQAGRETKNLRVAIASLPVKSLTGFLKAAGWSKSLNNIKKIKCDYLDEDGVITIDLDLGASVGCNIGLELKAERLSKFKTWNNLLQSFVDRQMCLEEKMHALLDWHGKVRTAENELNWPKNLIQLKHVTGGRMNCYFEQYISHIKVSLKPNRSLEVKGYTALGLKRFDNM
jgi:hypothetical protein